MSKQTEEKKFSKLLIAKIIVFAFEILGAIVVAILTACWDGISLNAGITILSANISILLLTSKLMEMLSDKETTDKEEAHFNTLIEKTDKIIDDIKIEEMYKKIYKIENREQREIYLKSVETFIKTMNNRIAGIRSGALSRHDYYVELTKAGDAIIADKNNHKIKSPYSGEIWAITCWQDDELDLSDEKEKAWIKKMEEMDALGISTKRLCIMKNRGNLLSRNSLDEDVISFLNKIQYYCSRNRVCKNTIVYAISDISSLNQEERDWINKGFFAIKLSNGYLRLIRGVSLDNPDATTLGGEIDFDENRVKSIRKLWESLISQSGEQTLNDYLVNNSSPIVKQKMIKMGFDINDTD